MSHGFWRRSAKKMGQEQGNKAADGCGMASILRTLRLGRCQRKQSVTIWVRALA
jgi:hypothetical protein